MSWSRCEQISQVVDEGKGGKGAKEEECRVGRCAASGPERWIALEALASPDDHQFIERHLT
jgi:hypothetical protein